jgi:hypothetical protein
MLVGGGERLELLVNRDGVLMKFMRLVMDIDNLLLSVIG